MSSDDRLDGNTAADWTAITVKSTLGAIPIAGSFLGEAASVLIPNQRIDRILKYVNELDSRLNSLTGETIDILKKNENFIDLIEEGFIQAARARSDERRRYIANTVYSGLADRAARANDAKYVLGILAEINDNEVIWLHYFCQPTIHDKGDFRKLHKNILSPVDVTLGSTQEEREQSALQDSYKEHLERLGLIRYNVRMDKKLNIPEYDKYTGKPKTSATRVTVLGEMLLRSIGLID